MQETEGGSFDVGWVEVYVSRQLASFGTRCATVNTTASQSQTILLRCTEGDFNAEGRFVYLRSFGSARELRIDGLRAYQAPGAGRRLNAEVPQEPPRDTTQERLAARMVNLTKTVCSHRFSDPALALSTRRDAAMLWAELHQDSSDASCFDCVAMRTGNCTEWFAHSYGLSKDAGPRADAHRRLREELRASEPHRRRKLEEALDASCCRVDRKTGQKECKKEFCHKAFKERANQRMGHVLRRMHELGHVELSVEQQVAVDILSPHIHSCLLYTSPSPRDS